MKNKDKTKKELITELRKEQGKEGSNITKLKKAEQSLQQSENRFRQLFNHMSSGVTIYEANADGSDFIIKDFNRAGERIDKIKKKDIIGKSVLEVFPEIKYFGFFKVLQEVYKTGKSKHLPVSLYKDQRITGWRENHVYKIPSGEIVEIVALYDDITVLKQAEEELEDSEEYLKKLFDYAPGAYYISDLKGNFIGGNKAAEKLTGYKVEELIGKNFLKLFSPTDIPKAAELLVKNNKGQPTGPDEFILNRKDKSNVPVELSTYPVKIKGRTFVLGMAMDITERKLAEEQLQQNFQRTKRAMDTTINTISKIAETRDPYTSGHQQRVSQLSVRIAREIHLPQEQIETIRVAALIHDIGKISIPSEILTKPGKLSDIEFSLIKGHPQKGYDILKDTNFPYPVIQIILQHHERINGSGYPNRLTGDEILLEAKIIAVADVVEAMASHRPYRQALGIEAALEEITKNKGILYDPKIVDVCVKLFREKGFKFE